MKKAIEAIQVVFRKKPVFSFITIASLLLLIYLSVSKVVFSTLQKNLSKVAGSDLRMQLLHDIVFHLSDAETDVRKFTLTNDPTNLVHYNDQIHTLQANMNEIETAWKESTVEAIIDSLQQSVDQKVGMFNAFMKQSSGHQLKKDLTQELKQTSDLISDDQSNASQSHQEKIQNEPAPVKTVEPEKKKFKIGDLFKSKKQKNPGLEINDPIAFKKEPVGKQPPNYDSLFSALQKKQQHLVEQQSVYELIWLQEDAALNSKIISYLKVLEKEEFFITQQNTIAAQAVVSRVFNTAVYLLALALSACTLLLIALVRKN